MLSLDQSSWPMLFSGYDMQPALLVAFVQLTSWHDRRNASGSCPEGRHGLLSFHQQDAAHVCKADTLARPSETGRNTL